MNNRMKVTFISGPSGTGRTTIGKSLSGALSLVSDSLNWDDMADMTFRELFERAESYDHVYVTLPEFVDAQGLVRTDIE